VVEKVKPVTVVDELLVIVIVVVLELPTAVAAKVVQLITVRGPTGGLQDPVPL
jgi:hypothetical protein